MADDPSSRLSHPAIKPPYVPVVIDRDTIEFRIGPWAGPAFTITDLHGDGRLADIAGLLDGHRSVHDILDEFPPTDRATIEDVIDRLYEDGVLVDAEAASADQLGGYLSSLAPFDGLGAPDVSDTAIVVVNVGTIGGMIIDDLRSMDVGDITLCEPTTDSTRRASNQQNLRETIEAADYVVYAETSPNPDLVGRINRYAIDTSTPWIPGRVHGLDGIIGPAVLPGTTSCYECFRSRASANMNGEADYQQIEAAGATDAPFRPGRSFARVIAGYLTIDLLHLLGNGTAFTLGRIFHFDFFDFSVESNTVLKLPRCRVCSQVGDSPLDRQRYLSFDQLIGDDSV